MADEEKKIWNVPLILFTVTHLVIIGATYGTLTNEMSNFNTSLKRVITELESTNRSIAKLRESDIRLQLQQEYNLKRLDKLENTK